ncbi:MAG: hypothetical protein QW190_01095 [Thermoproteota archaeon]
MVAGRDRAGSRSCRILGCPCCYNKLRGSGLRDGVLATMLGVVPDVDYVSPLPFGTPLGNHGLAHSPFLLIIFSMPFFAKHGLKAHHTS